MNCNTCRKATKAKRGILNGGNHRRKALLIEEHANCLPQEEVVYTICHNIIRHSKRRSIENAKCKMRCFDNCLLLFSCLLK